jgi:hypothetical protein
MMRDIIPHFRVEEEVSNENRKTNETVRIDEATKTLQKRKTHDA